MNRNNFILNRLFTRNILQKLLQKDNLKVYKEILVQYNLLDTNQKNITLLQKIYNFMKHNYRNEYFYQNTIFNKHLLGRHSLNTTTALTQLLVSESKVDLLLINGKAVVYEIKTELDNFERLDTQICNYYKGFNYVYVVTCEKNYIKLNELLKDTNVGIYVLTDKTNYLSLRKKALKYDEQLSHLVIFKYLRKKEFENIILKFYGYLPNVSPVFYYKNCFEMIQNIPILDFYNAAIKELKKRNIILKKQFDFVPYELKSLVYFYNPSAYEYKKLMNFLNQEYRG